MFSLLSLLCLTFLCCSTTTFRRSLSFTFELLLPILTIVVLGIFSSNIYGAAQLKAKSTVSYVPLMTAQTAFIKFSESAAWILATVDYPFVYVGPDEGWESFKQYLTSARDEQGVALITEKHVSRFASRAALMDALVKTNPNIKYEETSIFLGVVETETLLADSVKADIARSRETQVNGVAFGSSHTFNSRVFTATVPAQASQPTTRTGDESAAMPSTLGSASHSAMSSSSGGGGVLHHVEIIQASSYTFREARAAAVMPTHASALPDVDTYSLRGVFTVVEGLRARLLRKYGAMTFVDPPVTPKATAASRAGSSGVSDDGDTDVLTVAAVALSLRFHVAGAPSLEGVALALLRRGDLGIATGITLAFFPPFLLLLTAILGERETKMYEMLRVTGISLSSLALSWCATYAITSTAVAAVSAVVAWVTLLPNTLPIIIFLPLWLASLNAIALALFLSATLRSIRAVQMVGAVVFALLCALYSAVESAAVTDATLPIKQTRGTLIILHALSPAGLMASMNWLLRRARESAGVSFYDVPVTNDGVSMLSIMTALATGAIVFFLLGVYLYAVEAHARNEKVHCSTLFAPFVSLGRALCACCCPRCCGGSSARHRRATQGGNSLLGVKHTESNGDYDDYDYDNAEEERLFSEPARHHPCAVIEPNSDIPIQAERKPSSLASPLAHGKMYYSTSSRGGSTRDLRSGSDSVDVSVARGHSSADSNGDQNRSANNFVDASVCDSHCHGDDPEIVRIRNLRKEYPDSNLVAVKRFNLDIHRGELFALLGHNGAGKSTILNTLTGMCSPTAGGARIDGVDIRYHNRAAAAAVAEADVDFGLGMNRNSSDARRWRRWRRRALLRGPSIGFCPQHDVLYPTLTPRDHFELFARLRGVPSDKRDAEVEKWLIALNLKGRGDGLQNDGASALAPTGGAKFAAAQAHTAHLPGRLGGRVIADAPVSTLSGGQRRCVSLGIALIGDPKLVILDEPTAGLDVAAQASVRALLQEQRRHRAILLTTHSMEEAEICDRIGILANGSLQTVGSSLFLKRTFGAGYVLFVSKAPEETLIETAARGKAAVAAAAAAMAVLEPTPEELAVEESTRVRLTPSGRRIARALSAVSAELVALSDVAGDMKFAIPIAAVSRLPDLLDMIERDKSALKVASFSVSVTPLSDVFFTVANAAVVDDDVPHAVVQIPSVKLRPEDSLVHSSKSSLQSYREAAASALAAPRANGRAGDADDSLDAVIVADSMLNLTQAELRGEIKGGEGATATQSDESHVATVKHMATRANNCLSTPLLSDAEPTMISNMCHKHVFTNTQPDCDRAIDNINKSSNDSIREVCSDSTTSGVSTNNGLNPSKTATLDHPNDAGADINGFFAHNDNLWLDDFAHRRLYGRSVFCDILRAMYSKRARISRRDCIPIFVQTLVPVAAVFACMMALYFAFAQPDPRETVDFTRSGLFSELPASPKAALTPLYEHSEGAALFTNEYARLSAADAALQPVVVTPREHIYADSCYNAFTYQEHTLQLIKGLVAPDFYGAVIAVCSAENMFLDTESSVFKSTSARTRGNIGAATASDFSAMVLMNTTVPDALILAQVDITNAMLKMVHDRSLAAAAVVASADGDNSTTAISN